MCSKANPKSIMKIFAGLSIILIFGACGQNKIEPKIIKQNSTMSVPINDDKLVLERAKNHKKTIDTYFKDESSLETYVRLFNDQTIYKIGNHIPEDSIESTYKVLKGDKHQIIGIREIPVSESGDWSSSVMYYFDPQGNTSVINYEYSEFDEEVPGGVVHEVLTHFFNTDFQLIHRIHNITDRFGKPVSKLAHVVFSDTTTLSVSTTTYQKRNNFGKAKAYEQAVEEIKEYFISGAGMNKTNLHMVDSRERKTNFTRTIFYQDKGGSYDVTDARFFEGNTTAIQTNRIQFTRSEVRVLYSISTNIMETNKRRSYSPTKILLKIPAADENISWSYLDDEGEEVKCTTRWIMVNFEEESRKAIKLVSTLQRFPKIQMIEYYVKGVGLWGTEMVENGIAERQYQFDEIGFDNINNN